MVDANGLTVVSSTVQRRPERIRALLLVAAFALVGSFAPSASAQVVGPPVPGYVHNIWTTQHGLPQNQILTIVETRDGYLWAGTGSGLVRFDGLEFTVFDVSTTSELPANWISTLHEDPDGVLWIGTDRGLVTYRDRSFTREHLTPDIDNGWVSAIQQDSKGRLWVVIDGQVVGRDGTHWTALPLGDTFVTGLLVDHEDVLWIGTKNGLIEWRDRIVRTIGSGDGLPEGPGGIEPRYADRAGRIWIHTSPGLVLVDRETGKARPAPGPLAQAFARHIIADNDDLLWIGSRAALFTYARDGRVTEYPLGDSIEHVWTMARDRLGHIWFGVSGGRGGLRRLAPQRVTVLTREHGLPCENVVAITEAPDGAVWASLLCPGPTEGRLVTISDGRVTLHREPNGVRLPLVTALLAAPDGSLWVGTFEGQLLHIANGRSTRYTTANSGLVGREIGALHRDNEGALWIGTNAGLNRFHNDAWTTFRTDDGLADNDVRFITADSSGTLWIGTRMGVSLYANGRFTNLTVADGLPRGAVRSIHFDEEQTVWIGTYGGGLCRLKAGQITRFGRRGGLLDSGVHRILADDHGYFWMSGDQGIRRVSRDELNAVADGKSKHLIVDMYDERDGMKNGEANGMAQPAGWKMRDGSLWFPTQGGIVRIDRSTTDADVSVPQAIIANVLVSGAESDLAHEIVAPPGSTDLEIHYTAPEFSRPEQIQFRYRLDGHDADWVQAGTRRVAHYTNLAPGSYRFEVSARSSAGVWDTDGARLALVLRPHFHQQPAFHVLAVLLGAIVAYGMYTLRILQLRRRTRALEAVIAHRTVELLREREGLGLANEQLSEANAQLSDAKAVADASRGHLLSVLDELRVGVMVVDDSERVVFASRATCLLIAGTDEGIVGHFLGDVLPVSADVMTELRAHLRAARPGTRLTAKLEPPVGPEHYWTEIEARVDPLNEHHRILCFYDITEVFELKRSTDFNAAGLAVGLIGSSSPMRLVYAQIRTMASVDTTVLIEGETGTGKELVARSIHEASPRRHRRFVAINCAGLTESLLASQLFGHKRGAFTGAVSDHVGLFEAAQGGTLLLDEIGDMPMSMQTHLLRVLQEREINRVGDSTPRSIDVRVLASTHRSLEQEVAAGRFREDLLYRIRVARVHLPPLRQRTEDIPQLATAFVSQLSAAHGKHLNGISRDTMEQLVSHRWPGNVRELKSVIEWAVIHAPGPIVKQSDLPPELSAESLPPARATMPEADRRLLIETLKRTGGNRSVAARLLGVSRATLYRRLAALDEAAPEETPRSA